MLTPNDANAGVRQCSVLEFTNVACTKRGTPAKVNTQLVVERFRNSNPCKNTRVAPAVEPSRGSTNMISGAR